MCPVRAKNVWFYTHLFHLCAWKLSLCESVWNLSARTLQEWLKCLQFLVVVLFLTKIFRARAEWILPNPTTSQMMPRKGSLTNKRGERPRAKKPTSSRESLLFKASSCVVKAFCEAFSDSTSAFVVCSPLPRSATVWSAHKHVMLLLAAGLR